MTKLYRHPLSGHAHRAELFLSLIGKEVELVDVDLLAGEQKSEAFRALNPLGQVPVLDDEGTIISDSNAILVYLATKYAPESWYPREPERAAAVQKWLSVAAGEINSGPGAARLVKLFGAQLDHDRAKSIAHTLFNMVGRHLADNDFLVDGGPTIADVAAYTYIAHAPEGGVSLAEYGNITAWLRRVEALPGFVPMQSSPPAKAA
jgi:glutathione S-transferase